MYNVLADNWIKLGLPEDTRSSIQTGGFYTTVIQPGLRMISLNMNYCSRENFWLLINSTDPLDQLQWLIQWLQYAEDHEEKVHIIGHHPPSSCMPSFSWNYHKIINRFERKKQTIRNFNISFLDMKIPFRDNSLDIHIMINFICFTMRSIRNVLFPWLALSFSLQ